MARCQDWPEALHWYSTALETTDCDEGGEYDGMQDEPRYALLAREAEMLCTGGCGLKKDPQKSGGQTARAVILIPRRIMTRGQPSLPQRGLYEAGMHMSILHSWHSVSAGSASADSTNHRSENIFF